MAHHHLPSKPENIHWGSFSAQHRPVLEIASGDRVTIDTISGGRDQLPTEKGDWHYLPDHLAYLEVGKPAMRGHIMTGPIAVKGAKAGSVLEVRVLDVKLRQDWAWNIIMPLRGSLPHDFKQERRMTIRLDIARNKAIMPWGVELECSPFFGVMGVAPPPNWGEISSIQPRAHGGNLDIKAMVAGSTLYLPVWNDGALFSCGDGHAVQGDGEVCLSAAETALTGTFEFHVRDDMKLEMPQAETPTDYVTIGIDPDLDDAAQMALRAMIDLVCSKTNLAREDAFTLMSLAADTHVSQLVNENKGIHVMLPKAAVHGAK
ncbi:MAG: acetamidase/formamidase family protein [Alphaproteobacteria bacterium]